MLETKSQDISQSVFHDSLDFSLIYCSVNQHEWFLMLLIFHLVIFPSVKEDNLTSDFTKSLKQHHVEIGFCAIWHSLV